MNWRKFSGVGIFALCAVFSIVLLSQAQENNVQFPVPELGNCQDKEACRVYCDKPENVSACLSFAEKHNLMAKGEIETARKLSSGEMKGPGGCKNKAECQTYCDSISNIDECVAFAEKNDIISADELKEAKKVQEAIKRGVKPPACGNKKSCDQYCAAPEHMEECMAFAMEAGFMSDSEKQEAQKMVAALKRGVRPPPCRGKEECDSYCGVAEHIEECMSFAMEAGLMNEAEKADAQKTLQAIKKGAKLPSCRGKEECDKYCSEESHVEECINFAAAAGFMKPEEAERAKRTKGRGPGGCRGEEECKAFCSNPANQQNCFNFSKENGLMSDDELKKVEGDTQRFRDSINQAPPEVKECLNSSIGDLQKFTSGGVMPMQEEGQKMRECFEKVMGRPGEGQGAGPGGMMPSAGFGGGPGAGQPMTGPGGCKSPEECDAFCKSNPDACQNFGPGPAGQPSGQGGAAGGGPAERAQGGIKGEGPRGCKTPEECRTFCQSNPDQCRNFVPAPDRIQRGSFQEGITNREQPPGVGEGNLIQPPGDGAMPPYQGGEGSGVVPPAGNGGDPTPPRGVRGNMPPSGWAPGTAVPLGEGMNQTAPIPNFPQPTGGVPGQQSEVYTLPFAVPGAQLPVSPISPPAANQPSGQVFSPPRQPRSDQSFQQPPQPFQSIQQPPPSFQGPTQSSQPDQPFQPAQQPQSPQPFQPQQTPPGADGPQSSVSMKSFLGMMVDVFYPLFAR